ncbi:hypothetical protein N474_23100 [Pseudoalteromonas luteoviolacea CPMOR-2]|uniref:TolB family protein n=1 Tax=Pseudoalteromonas luteoviolacea TaxID=43657 RepID=UPI0007B06B80|nr:DUF5050 domain-containing protein [Pseudoalteromonas luteoviolacea]KZN52332.1 hypothetical protein N474_23100 [Pseudoalteromonas luteoviolacea CPMOR-2]
MNSRLLKLSLASTIAVVAGTQILGCHATQSDEHASYKLIYSSLESTKRSIYLSDEHGVRRLKVIDATDSDGYPAVSPDGKLVAFYGKYDKFKTWSIHSVAIDGSNLKRLTHTKNKWDSAPAWSLDGRTILFTREYKNPNGKWQSQIWLMNADGSEQRKISGLQGGGASFIDNDRVLFHSHTSPSQISIANIDGSNMVKLTNDATDNRAPRLSPDGNHIVYLSNRDGNQEVYIMDINGKNQKRLTFNQVEDWDATWSADGNQIFFASENSQGSFDIYKAKRDGSSLQKVLNRGSQVAAVKTLNAAALQKLIQSNPPN